MLNKWIFAKGNSTPLYVIVDTDSTVVAVDDDGHNYCISKALIESCYDVEDILARA